MIPVTYLHDSKNRLYNDSGRWLYGAVWMPIDVEYTINVSRNGIEMMQKEQDEGEEQPEGKGQYLNARRFYRDMVEAELRSTAEDAA